MLLTRNCNIPDRAGTGDAFGSASSVALLKISPGRMERAGGILQDDLSMNLSLNS